MEYTLDNSKQELISEIDRRVDDKIIEKTNANLIKKLINGLSVEKNGYESCYSAGMLVRIRELGFESLKDLIDSL